MTTLFQDFITEATATCKILVHEKPKPLKQKSIRPVSGTFGVAGGIGFLLLK
jgi:hypothetical protein